MAHRVPISGMLNKIKVPTNKEMRNPRCLNTHHLKHLNHPVSIVSEPIQIDHHKIIPTLGIVDISLLFVVPFYTHSQCIPRTTVSDRLN